MTRAGAALFTFLALVTWWWGWAALWVALGILAWLILSTMVCAFIAGAARERDQRR